MAKKKDAAEPKRYGTLIRVSDEFADAIRDVASIKRISVADVADSDLLAVLKDVYLKAVQEAMKRHQGNR